MTLRRPLRLVLATLAGILVLALVAVGGALLWLRSTLPQRDGSVAVAGVSALTTVETGQDGVPRIEASTLQDGAFALGWVHAQDRFFQMDLARRLVHGRLSELFGPRTLELDRRSRQLGFARYLQGEIDALDPAQRQLLEAYAQGVNAAIAREGTPWALRLLRAGRPAPWTPLDSAALVLYMDDRLTEDGDEELRAATVARVGARTATWLMDVEPAATPAIMDAGESTQPAAPSAPAGGRGDADGAVKAVPGRLDGRTGMRTPRPESALGSNAWAVDGRWVAGKGPLLCNDTHLMHALPALFHAFELRLPGRRLAGFAIPGAPLTVIGTNGALAWGVTTLYDDAVDYLLEQFVDGDSTRVQRAGATESVQQRWEQIVVRGRSAPDSLLVRWTSQGPLVRLEGARRPATRRWVRHAGGGTLSAMLRLQDATSLEAASRALSTYAGPGQNFVLADTLGPDGRVGWVPAGRWPRRDLRSNAGEAPGATSDTGSEAPGFVAPGEVPGALPQEGSAVAVGMPPMASFGERPLLIPAVSGCVITANHRVTRGDDGLRMTPRWPLPWRAMRLRERLENERPWTAQSMAGLQMDAVVESARRFARLLSRTPPPDGAPQELAEAWERLATWDGSMAGDERPTVWRATMDRVGVELFADDWPAEIPDLSPEQWGTRSPTIPLERATLRVLGLLGETPFSVADDSLDARDWIDDQRTPAHEGIADVVARALGWGLSALRARYGADPARWRWDHVHTITLEHPLAAIPVLGNWLRLGPSAVPGGSARHLRQRCARRDRPRGGHHPDHAHRDRPGGPAGEPLHPEHRRIRASHEPLVRRPVSPLGPRRNVAAAAPCRRRPPRWSPLGAGTGAGSAHDLVNACGRRQCRAVLAMALAAMGAAHAAHAQGLHTNGTVDQVDPWAPNARYDAAVPTPAAALGMALGDRPATVDEILAYARRLAQSSDRVTVEPIGHSVEGDPLVLLIITDPANAARLRTRTADVGLLGDPRQGTPALRRQARERTLAVTWIACSVHGDEASGADAGLQLAYQLAAGLDPATRGVLERSVVVIDPCQNPDGRRRFTAHVRAFTRASPEPDDTPAAAEHTQSWPGGRRNHYLFDLNRDWIYLTQPETNARVAAFLRWRPQVLADLHEMGRESSYFFPPPADPINPNVSPQMRRWWEVFGRANAAAFDARGYTYFVREGFDLFYPGYGDSWPTLHGAVGMTYEQGTTRGLRIQDASGEVLTYRDTVRRHFTAAWTTCVTAAQHGPELLEGFEQIAHDALQLASRDPVRALLVDPTVHPACARELAQVLSRQGIEVRQADAPFEARVRPWGGEARNAAARRAFGPGTWVLPYDQPSYPLLRSLLDQEVPLDKGFVEQERARKQRGLEDRFYDVTAWSMILSYDVAAFACDQAPDVAAHRVAAEFVDVGTDTLGAPTALSAPITAPADGARPIAWLFPYEDHTALAAACALMRRGVHVWVCRDEAVRDGQRFPAGTFVVKAGGDADNELQATVEQAAAQTGARVMAATRAWSDEGPSLGSARVAYLRPPRIAVVIGPGTRPESVGGVCWYLEQRLHYPYSSVFASSFKDLRLAELDAIVFPDLDAEQLDLSLDALDTWVQGGGVLVAIGRAAAWLAAARTDWTSLEPITDLRELGGAAAPDSDAAQAKPEALRPRTAGSSHVVLPDSVPAERASAHTVNARRDPDDSGAGDGQQIPLEKRPDRIPGAIGRVRLDLTHFLAFGQHDDELFVPILSGRIFRPSVAGWNVGVYEEHVRVAGFMWPDMEAALRGAAYAVDEPWGSGHLILFAEDPTFRGAWEGSSRLLLNALLLAPSLRR